MKALVRRIAPVSIAGPLLGTLIGLWSCIGHTGIALVGGTLHTLADDKPIDGGTVLIEAGRILAVGRDLVIPDGFETIDVAGRIITPGLIEPASQLGLSEIPGETTTVDSLVTAYPSGASFDIRHALNASSIAIAVNRRDGVTRAVVAPAPGNDPFAGWGAAIRLTDSEILVQPGLALFASATQAASAFAGGSRSAVIQRLERGLQLAEDFSFSRYVPGPGDFSRQDLQALKKFRDSAVPLVVEVHRSNEIREIVGLAERFALRLIVLGGTEAWQVADVLAAHKVPVIVDVLANLPVSYDRLGARLDNAALLERAGVRVAFTAGNSQNAGWVRQMAGNAVAHGLPWPAALAAITRNPAQIWPLTSGLGTLTKGAPADLVVWTGDPLELNTWAERVMIDGQWQDLLSRQTRLFDRYSKLSEEDFYYR